MSVRPKLYPIVSRLAAVVLLLAGTLKVQAMLAPSASEPPSATNLAHAGFELLFGVWLMIGRFPRWSRLATLLCFAVFFNVALLRWLQSAPSCGCFGLIEVQTRVTVFLDLLMLLSLLAASPVLESRPPARGTYLRLTVGALPIVAVLGLIGWQAMVALNSVRTPASAPAGGKPASDAPPIVQRVIQGVEQNHAALRSLTATFDVTLTTFSQPPKTPAESLGKGKKEEKPKAVPRTHRLAMKSILRGDDLRRDCDTQLADFDAREICVDCGDRRIQYLPGLHQAWLSETSARERSRTETIDLRCAGFHPPIRNIADWLRKAKVLDAAIIREGDPGEVVRLRVLAEGIAGAKDEVVLDCVAQMNYLPARIVYRFHPEGSVFTVADLEYQKAEQAVWLPKKWKCRTFLRGTTTSADATAGFDLLAETEMRSLSVNREVSEEVFDPVLPPDTRLVGNLALRTRTDDAPVRASAVMSKQPIQDAAPSSPASPPFYWLLGGIDVAAASLLLIFRGYLAL